MPLPQITIDGFLHSIELRFTPAGKAVAKLRVRCGEKKRDDGSYGDSLWVDASLWEVDAEAAADAVKEGDAITLTGVLHQRQYDKADGTKGTSLEVKFGRLSTPVRGRGVQGQGGRGQQPYQQAPTQGGYQAPANDPWATPGSDSPPF